SRPSYHVGDVVGYHSNAIHRDVLHRIIARHGDRFVFKGDNNDFLDPEQPAASQLFGRRWLVVPNAGSVLEQVHAPRYAAGLAGLAVLVLVGVGPAGGVRRRRRQPPEAASERPAATGAPPPRARR